jgi:hypothetical protein
MCVVGVQLRVLKGPGAMTPRLSQGDAHAQRTGGHVRHGLGIKNIIEGLGFTTESFKPLKPS